MTRGTSRVQIWCATREGDEYVVTVPKVEMLRMNDFTGGNVINAITIYWSAECPVALYARLWQLEASMWSEILNARFGAFKSERWLMAEFATSDGASLIFQSAAAPGEITIESGDDPTR